MFNINNLPHKKDFCIDNETIINQIKSNYLSEFNKWIKSDIKEQYITVSTPHLCCLVNDKVENNIYKLFSFLGFSYDDIEICDYLDTHRMYVKLKVY